MSPEKTRAKKAAVRVAKASTRARGTSARRAAVPTRRTQAERRDATVGKLVEAAIDALYEVGYSATTIQEISDRSGVSHGGLFRHFDSRTALLAEAGRVLVEKLRARFRMQFERAREEHAHAHELALVARIAQSNVWSREQHALFELQVAARTDAALYMALAPVMGELDPSGRTLARELLRDTASRFRDVEVLVDVVLTLCRGGAIAQMARTPTPADTGRMAFFLATVERAYGVR